MLGEWLEPVTGWFGLALVPFLLIVMLIALVIASR